MGSNQSPLAEAAQELARHGFRVFPLAWPVPGGCSCQRRQKCPAAGKHPLQAGWQQTATADPVKVAQIWRTWPQANIGVVTGETSNLVVVDLDPDKGGEESLEAWQRKFGRLPATVEVLTGSGGRHLYFRHPGEFVANKQQWADLPGLDIRGDGGLVVGPGSLHACGRHYEWELSSHPDDVSIAELPEALRRLLVGAKAPSEKREVKDEGRPAPAGPVLEGCAWVRHCINDAATLGEQEWYALLTIAGRLEDGPRLAHQWSRPHPGYSPEETEEKLRHAVMDTGPYRCETIRHHMNGETHCAGCQHWGKVSSPVVLGRKREVQWDPVPENAPSAASFGDEDVPPDPDAVATGGELARHDRPQGKAAVKPTLLRVLPASEEAERATLAAAFVDRRSAVKICADLHRDDYSFEPHRWVFDAVQDLTRQDRTATAQAVADWLRREGMLEKAGGEEFLQIISGCGVSFGAVREYIGLVQEKAELRWIIQRATELTDSAYGERSPSQELRQRLVRSVLERERVRTPGRGARDLRDVWLDELNRIDQGIIEPVLYTGLRSVDRLAQGLQRGELAIICGRPGMGKTVAGLQLARHAAETWGNTCIISLEMDAESIARRAIATESGLTFQQIRDCGLWVGPGRPRIELSEDDKERVSEAVKQLRRTKHALLVDEECQQLSRLIYRAHSLKIDPGIEALVVDYGQLIKDDTLAQKSRVEEVTRVARALKNEVARPLNIPVYVLVQANRESDKRGASGKQGAGGKSTGSLLMMSDLGWAAEWEQVAFQIHFLNRDPQVDRPEDGQEPVAPVAWDIHKNRNGVTGIAHLALDKARFRFAERYS